MSLYAHKYLKPVLKETVTDVSLKIQLVIKWSWYGHLTLLTYFAFHAEKYQEKL